MSLPCYYTIGGLNFKNGFVTSCPQQHEKMQILDDAWLPSEFYNNELFRKHRLEMMRGEWSAGCDMCEHVERDRAGKSMRQELDADLTHYNAETGEVCSCCTHQARRASPRASCTRPVATSLMWRTPIATFSTFIVTEMCTGARLMSAGLLATHTSCMARLQTAPPRSCTKVYQTTRVTTGSGRSSKSTRSPSSTPHRLRSERS